MIKYLKLVSVEEAEGTGASARCIATARQLVYLDLELFQVVQAGEQLVEHGEQRWRSAPVQRANDVGRRLGTIGEDLQEANDVLTAVASQVVR
jgi:hypothetical protein